MASDFDTLKDGMEARAVRRQMNELIESLRAETWMNVDDLGPLLLQQDGNGKYLGLDVTVLAGLLTPYGITRDFNFYRGTQSNWFTSLIVTDELSANCINLAVDYLVAVPFLTMRGGVLSQIAFELQAIGATGERGVVGVYDNVDDLTNYPNNLLAQGTAVDLKAATPGLQISFLGSSSVTLSPGGLYWLAFGTNLRTTTAQFTFMPGRSIPNVLGYDDGGWLVSGETKGNYGWVANTPSGYTYSDTLPATFPAQIGGNVIRWPGDVAGGNDDALMVGVRFSS